MGARATGSDPIGIGRSRRIAGLILTVALLAALVGCGDENPGDGATGGAEAATTPAGDDGDTGGATPPPPALDLDLDRLDDLTGDRFELGWMPVGAGAMIDIGGVGYDFPMRVDGYSTCSAITAGDDLVVITDFKLAEDRTTAVNFAFTADQSQDMVVWGLHDPGTGEEWSGDV